MILEYKGRDSWNRPVYEDEAGNLWKDTDPRASRPAKLCSVLNNSFDGEPDTPLEVMKRYRNEKITFTPKRETW